MSDSLIHLRVPAAVKGRWVRASRAAGLRLTDWIVQAVESQIIQDPSYHHRENIMSEKLNKRVGGQYTVDEVPGYYDTIRSNHWIRIYYHHPDRPRVCIGRVSEGVFGDGHVRPRPNMHATEDLERQILQHALPWEWIQSCNQLYSYTVGDDCIRIVWDPVGKRCVVWSDHENRQIVWPQLVFEDGHGRSIATRDEARHYARTVRERVENGWSGDVARICGAAPAPVAEALGGD